MNEEIDLFLSHKDESQYLLVLKIALLGILCDIKLMVGDITRRLVMYTAYFQSHCLISFQIIGMFVHFYYRDFIGL